MIKWLNRFEHPLPNHSADIIFKISKDDIRLGIWNPKTEVNDLGEEFLGTLTTQIGDVDKVYNIWYSEHDLVEYVFATPHNLNKIE